MTDDDMIGVWGTWQEDAPSRADILLARGVREQNVDLVKQAIEAGASLHADQGGRSPLWFATMNQQKDIVRLMLDEGATMNTAFRHDDTPSLTSMPGPVQAFVQEVADKPEDWRPWPGDWAMHIQRGNREAFLQSAKSWKDEDGQWLRSVQGEATEALETAAVHGRSDIMGFLAGGFEPTSGVLFQAATLAARYGQEEAFEALLDTGMPANIRHEGDPLLAAVIRNGCPDGAEGRTRHCIQMLLDRDAAICDEVRTAIAGQHKHLAAAVVALDQRRTLLGSAASMTLMPPVWRVQEGRRQRL
ncbi:hypothetical protein [Pseudomarimonas arenosa]|uniref:Ankyrin repeat protein n=1 Tax=Pseudomarimonas arenosa TaxID=2774145 RepID=A0AAW3ZQ66_9GAMM|nr:hypothetical protein [Pseudomarimonas arenosa]MBD8527292.1 hypothetical protein [Pseudomarimonas arenosa]